MPERRFPRILITMGDPNGIGPEIALKSLVSGKIKDNLLPLIVGCPGVLSRAASALNLNMPIVELEEEGWDGSLPVGLSRRGKLDYIPVVSPGCRPLDRVRPGEIHRQAGRMAYKAVEKAHQLITRGLADAMVTGPISKQALNKAGYKRVAHTEILAHLTRCKEPITVFVLNKLWVGFFSRHLPLGKAVQAVRRQALVRFVENLHASLEAVGRKKPRLAVAALNPHAGEGGLLGREEEKEIVPAVAILEARGLDIQGPIPADYVFHAGLEGLFDCVVSLYHDQGHVAVKTAGFHQTVSLTLGLPYLRASVDHGTGFDIAWQGRARSKSMEKAIKLAADLVMKKNRSR